MARKLPFSSDTHASVHPDVMRFLLEINQGDAEAYGEDPLTQEVYQLLRAQFGHGTVPIFALTGTAANILSLKPLLKSYEGIICADSSHLRHNESGAPEYQLGTQLMLVPHQNGKLTIEGIKPYLHQQGCKHSVEPRVISIAQCTEFGTTYTLEETRALADFAHVHNMLLHIDGARLANAAAHLQTDLKAMTFDVGADVITFGGTKNGLMAVEAVIFSNANLASGIEYYQKQLLQLASKHRYISAQFIPYLQDDLWKLSAQQANDAAQNLAATLAKNGIQPDHPVEGNMIFTCFNKAQLQKVLQAVDCLVWDPELNQVRFVTSFDTTESDIEAFAKVIASI